MPSSWSSSAWSSRPPSIQPPPPPPPPPASGEVDDPLPRPRQRSLSRHKDEVESEKLDRTDSNATSDNARKRWEICTSFGENEEILGKFGEIFMNFCAILPEFVCSFSLFLRKPLISAEKNEHISTRLRTFPEKNNRNFFRPVFQLFQKKSFRNYH